jgi:hypothetical protein
MVVRPEPPLGTDSPDELAEHVTQFRDDWLVYLRSLTGYTAEIEERLQLEKDQAQQVQSQFASQLSAANGVIEFQKKQYKETLKEIQEELGGKIIRLEIEKEKALLAAIPTVITPETSPEPRQSTEIRVDLTEGKTPAITTTPPASSKISERLPDPEKFDGNRKDLRRFTQQIYSKLTANSDRFISANSRLAYVASRLSGSAYELILPKVKFGIYQFVDYPQMLEYLEKAFGDPDRIKNAQNDLFRLRQKNTDFSAFFAEFERLALEGEMPDSALTPLLNQTISRELQEMLLHNPSPSDEFRTFARHLQELENRRRQYYQNTHTGRNETTIRSFQPRQTTPAPQPPRPAPRQTTHASVTREQTTGDPMDLSVQRYASRPDKETGNCYRCHRPGHRIRDCPLPDTRPIEIQKRDEANRQRRISEIRYTRTPSPQ